MRYSEFDQVKLKQEDGVKVTSINAAIRKLVQNDQTFMPETIFSPTVWEARWNIDSTFDGYSKGDAVWLNTESIDEFVRDRASDIEAYSVFNQAAKREIDAAKRDGSSSDYQSALKRFILGQFPGQTEPIYFLGDITSPVRIRISKIDCNRSLPTEDSAWEDFFTDGEKRAEEDIRNGFQTACTEQFARHMMEYHTVGSSTTLEEISAKYLLSNFSNVAESQKFNSHYWYATDVMTGFDCVKKFVMKKLGNGLCKWFRVWNSGLVEHGGIVSCTEPSKSGDTSNGHLFTVRLNWAYDGGTAPTYDYPPEGIVPFYGNDTSYVDEQTSLPLRNSGLGQSMRYTVQLSVANRNDDQIPYGSKGAAMQYDSADVCFMNNSDFSFLVSPGSTDTFVSYLVRGYSIKVSRQS